MKPLSVYIHVPYCKSKCKYCHFTSDNDYSDVFSYVEAVKTELKSYAPRLKDRTVKTLFIGGGTPITLPQGALGAIVKAVEENYNLDLKEFTVEGNPEFFTAQKVAELKAIGVDRVSVGVQSLNDDELILLGRIHNAETALRALDLLNASFPRVNADVMVGLPNSDLSKTEHTVTAVLNSGVGHLSCYGLQLERGTPLCREVKSGLVSVPDDDEAAEQYDLCRELAAQKGLSRYEISNFARTGEECLHNLNYWECGEYLGIGVAAHGYIGGVRYANALARANYIDKLNRGVKPSVSRKRITIAEQKSERIMLGLRLAEGMDVARFNSDFKTDFFAEYSSAVAATADYTLFRNGRFCVKPEFLYVVNSVIVEFI